MGAYAREASRILGHGPLVSARGCCSTTLSGSVDAFKLKVDDQKCEEVGEHSEVAIAEATNSTMLTMSCFFSC